MSRFLSYRQRGGLHFVSIWRFGFTFYVRRAPQAWEVR
jgi:hypothetical protein